MARQVRPQLWRTTWRIAVALVLALLAFGVPMPASQPLGAGIAVAAAGGRLLVPRLQGLTILDLASGGEERLLAAPQPVQGAAWSPDGTMLAVLGGNGLWLIDPAGGEQATLLSYGSYGLFDRRP